MQTIEGLVDEILRDLPEISGHTITPAFEVVNGEMEFYDQNGQILFSGVDQLELEREYHIFTHAEFPDFTPF